MDCLFCKIAEGAIPCTKVYEDEHVLAFRDINPVAPQHIIIIPKKHFDSIMDLNDDKILSSIVDASKKIATELKIDKSGFRLVNNCGEDGGQTVKHLHFHLIGGRSFNWPPG